MNDQATPNRFERSRAPASWTSPAASRQMRGQSAPADRNALLSSPNVWTVPSQCGFAGRALAATLRVCRYARRYACLDAWLVARLFDAVCCTAKKRLPQNLDAPKVQFQAV